MKDCLVTPLTANINDSNLPILGRTSFGFTQSGGNQLEISALSGKSIIVSVPNGSFSVSGTSGLTELEITTSKTLTFTDDVRTVYVDNYYNLNVLAGNTLSVPDSIKFATGLTRIVASAYNCKTEDLPRTLQKITGRSLGNSVKLSGDVTNLPTTLISIVFYEQSAGKLTGNLNNYLDSLTQNLNNVSFSFTAGLATGNIIKLANHYTITQETNYSWDFSGCLNIEGNIEDVAQHFSNCRSQRLRIYCKSTKIKYDGSNVGTKNYVDINWDSSGNVTYDFS